MQKNLKIKVNTIIVKIYNKIMAGKFVNMNNKLSRRIRQILLHNICYQCETRFGELYPERKFYVIRCPKDDLGFFGLYNYVVDHMKKAVEMGTEPIVDWKYYPNSYISEDKYVGKENAWEWFFEPPTGISIDDVYKSKNVIMGGREWITSLGEVRDREKIKESNNIINKYIRLNEDMKVYISSEYQRIGMEGKRVLGLKCRGTDFVETKPKYHSIMPDIEQIREKINEMQTTWGGYDKIFIATEDDNIYKQMKLLYQDKLISCNTTTRIKSSEGKWLSCIFDKMDEKRTAMAEYIREIYLLAECDALIAPVIGGTLGAVRIKGGYDNQFFFNLGSYK